MYTEFWCGKLRERVNLENLRVDRRIILKYVFKKWNGGALTEFIWLRMGIGGALW